MKELIESVAAKAAGGWQNAGSKFDFEVFALPGGSVIAVALWCWSMAVMMAKSAHENQPSKRLPLDAQTADSAGPDATHSRTLPEPIAAHPVLLRKVAPQAGCTWRGAHCT